MNEQHTPHPTTQAWWPKNGHGFLRNAAHPSLIVSPFAEAAQAAVQAFLQHIGPDLDSIYVTGSVSRGQAAAGLSDLNMIAVTADTVDADLVLQDWIPDAEDTLLADYPFLPDVQLELWPYYYVFNDPARFSIGAFILATQSVCLWGGDLTPQLPDYRISAGIANDDLVRMAEDFSAVTELLAADASPDHCAYWNRWLARQVLRTAFGLVQLEVNEHTRDPRLCASVFSQQRPALADAINAVLAVAQNPPHTLPESLHWLHQAQDWLLPLVDTWLDQHNPNRDEALLVDDQEAL